MHNTDLFLDYKEKLGLVNEEISILLSKDTSDPDIKNKIIKLRNRRYYIIRQLRKIQRSKTWLEFNFSTES